MMSRSVKPRTRWAAPLLAALLSAGRAFALSPEEWAELQRRAEAGDVTAMHHLGLRHAAPKEAGADWTEAVVWLTLAEEKGEPDKALPQLRAQLNPDQLERAEKRLADLRQKLGLQTVAPAPSPAAESSPISPAAAAPAPASESEARKLSDELAAAWKEADRLREETREREAKLRDLLRQFETAQATWAEEKKDLVSRLGSGTDQTKSLQDKAQQLIQINQQLSSAQAELRARVAELTSQLREREASGRDSESARGSLQKDLQARTAEVTALKSQVDALAAQLAEARAKRDAADQAKAAAESALVEAKGRAEALASELARKMAAGSEANELRVRLATAEREREEARGIVTAASAGNTSLTQRVIGLEAQLSQAQATVSALEAKITTLEGTNKVLEAKLAQAAVTEKQLEAQRNAGDEAALSEARARLAQLEKRLAETEQRNDRLNVTLLDANARAKTGDALVADLKQAQKRVAELEDQHAKANAAAAAEHLRLAVEADRLKLQLARTSGLVAALDSLRQELRQTRFALALAEAAEKDARAHLDLVTRRAKR
jgi:golgin subfamily B member 1